MKLEDLAKAVAAETGCPIPLARLAVMAELTKWGVHEGRISLDEANTRLERWGAKLTRRDGR